MWKYWFSLTRILPYSRLCSYKGESGSVSVYDTFNMHLNCGCVVAIQKRTFALLFSWNIFSQTRVSSISSLMPNEPWKCNQLRVQEPDSTYILLTR